MSQSIVFEAGGRLLWDRPGVYPSIERALPYIITLLSRLHPKPFGVFSAFS